MLYIYIEQDTNESYKYVQSNYITRVSSYFDNEYEDDWFLDDFTKKVIKEIDDSDVIDRRCIYNEYGGSLPVTEISTGAKSLLLLRFTNNKVSGDRMGDNCLHLLLEIAEVKDIHISLDHIAKFPDKFNAVIENTGKKISSMSEFVDEYIRSKQI